MRDLATIMRAFLQGAWRRLPVETLAVLAAAASTIALLHDARSVWLLRLILAALVATPLAFSLHGLGRRLEIAGGVAAFAATLLPLVLAVRTIDDFGHEAILWPYGLTLAAAVLVPFVVAARRFTGFVRRFFEELTTWTLLWSAASAAIGFISLALVELFDLKVYDLAADAVLLVTGAMVLVFLDRLLPDHAPTGKIPQLWRRLAAGIGAPFVSVMLLILVVYELSVVVRGELPRNILSPLIMGAGFVGFLCTLILAAVADEPTGSGTLAPANPHHFLRTPSIRLARAFPAVLVLLLPMAMWALWVRIDQYGLTPFRVVRAASLLCLALLGVLGALRWIRGRAPLAWQVPATIAGFALATAFGPTSAVSLSVASQSARLVRLLDAMGLPHEIPTAPLAATHGDARVDELREAIAAVGELGGEPALRRVLTGDVASCLESYTCLSHLGVTGAPESTWHVGYVDPGLPMRDGPRELRFVDVDREAPRNGLVIVGTEVVFEGGARASLAAQVTAAQAGAMLPAEAVLLTDAAGTVVGRLFVQRIDVRRWPDGRVEVERLSGVWIR